MSTLDFNMLSSKYLITYCIMFAVLTFFNWPFNTVRKQCKVKFGTVEKVTASA